MGFFTYRITLEFWQALVLIFVICLIASWIVQSFRRGNGNRNR